MPSSNKFPQDNIPHLSESFEVEGCNQVFPTGDIPLAFERLSPPAFEHLCWRLILKDHQIVGQQLVGGSGSPQHGLDLFAFDYFDPEKLVVFECKCWSKFPADELEKAVSNFLKGAWAKRTSRFTLILAQETLGNLSSKWLDQRGLLQSAGIEADIWTGAQLTERIQRFPDLLSKFFPTADIRFFGNEWMQRTGFIERLSQALADPRPNVVRAAKEYLSNTGTKPTLLDENTFGNQWSIKTPWVHLSSFLPDGQFYPGSALVVLKRNDLMGASITFDQKWLLNNLLCTPGAPLTNEFRPFINGVLPESQDEERYVVDLKNCRCTLSDEGMNDLALAVDRLSSKYLEALLRKEAQWGSSEFPVVDYGGPHVAICTLPEWLWQDILDFTNVHDFEKGDTEWHFFDRALGCLKPYSKSDNDTYKRGYHGIFYISRKLEEITYGHEVALLWTPPDMIFDKELSPQKWWPCDFAYTWISEHLIPEVIKWKTRESFNEAKYFFSRSRKRKELFERLNTAVKIGDVRTLELVKFQRYRNMKLHTIVETLQSHFHLRGTTYISTDEMVGLYRALILLLKGKRGHLSYISGSLSIQGQVDSHLSVTRVLEKRISSGELNSDISSVDYTLRAMMSACGDDDNWIPEEDKCTVHEMLLPFMRHYDQSMLIRRHSKWT